VRDRRFAGHVVDAWVGNSEKVRREHYLLVTDADYQAAVSGAGEIPAHIPAHSPLIMSHQESSKPSVAREKSLEVVKDAENQYPRQGSLIRSFAREKYRFWKVTSLNPTLFQGRPSPLADNC
jgi:hypothetical protein